jgi:hypothetical protein
VLGDVVANGLEDLGLAGGERRFHGMVITLSPPAAPMQWPAGTVLESFGVCDRTKRETIGAQRDDRDDVVAHIRIVLSGGPRVIYNR